MNINYYEVIIYLLVFYKVIYITKTLEYKETFKRVKDGNIISHVVAILALVIKFFIIYKAIHFND